MADIFGAQPVQTINNGDVVAKLADGTVGSQLLAIDSSGRIVVKNQDGAGNNLTSQVNGSQQALDVGINVAGVQVDPRQIRALTASDVVTAQQGTSPWIAKDQADGPVAPGAVASFSQLAGGQYNSTPPTLTNTQQAALQVDANGRLIVASASTDDHNYGVVGATTLRTAAQIGNATGAADFNFGTVGAQTLRTAAQMGNATGAADFNNGATGAQTLRTAANLAVAGANVSNTNPVPVVLATGSAGTYVNKYNTTASLATSASTNHDYTITASKTMTVRKFWASASGAIRADMQTSPDGTTFTTFWTGFNSASNPNITVDLDTLAIQDSGTGSKIRIVITNDDNKVFNVYSTISGVEA